MDAHEYWQELDPPGSRPPGMDQGTYVAELPDGRQLRLPIRRLADSNQGLASLIINQASFAVQRELARLLALRLAEATPDIVVGLPTLGLTLAATVAEELGHPRYVPLGTSRKFWYDDALSVPLSSVTTPDAKRLFIDPRLLPLLEGKRIALVDDVISSGRSIVAGLELLQALGTVPVVIGAAMLQSERWRSRPSTVVGWQALVRGCFSTPVLELGAC